MLYRRLVIALALLLLGTIINIAVAWGCALWSVEAEELQNINFDKYWPEHVNPQDKRWLRSNGWSTPQDKSLTFGNLWTFGYYQVKFFTVPSIWFDTSMPHGRIDSYSAVAARIKCGFPFFSLSAEKWLDRELYKRKSIGDFVKQSELYNYDSGISIAVEVGKDGVIEVDKVLPLSPIWKGFVINTIFYAVIIWAILLGLLNFRSFARRRRGLCIKCGYDVGSVYSSDCLVCGWKPRSASLDDPMKRGLFKLALFLILGAIVNVAVAWGCAMFIDREYTSDNGKVKFTYEYILDGGCEFQITTMPGVQIVFVDLRRLNDPTSRNNPQWSKLATPRWIRSSAPSAVYIDGSIDEDERVMFSYGWPARTLYCDYLCHGSGWAFELRSGISLPGFKIPTSSFDKASAALPLRPIFPAFILNTMFYTAILSLLYLPFALHRLRRHKRGCCPNCAYDMRGNPGGGCPECGWKRA